MGISTSRAKSAGPSGLVVLIIIHLSGLMFSCTGCSGKRIEEHPIGAWELKTLTVTSASGQFQTFNADQCGYADLLIRADSSFAAEMYVARDVTLRQEFAGVSRSDNLLRKGTSAYRTGTVSIQRGSIAFNPGGESRIIEAELSWEDALMVLAIRPDSQATWHLFFERDESSSLH